MFRDRIDAGKQLSQRLLKYKNQNVVVLAIPRGGLPIGAIVAKTLKVPLDVALSKKIGHPHHKEYAIGAISLEDILLSNAIGIDQDYIENEAKKIRKRLQELHNQYYKKRIPENLEGKTVIIVDDGIATGNTLLVTIALVTKQKPAKIIVAIPVAPSSALQKLKNNPKVNEVVCLLEPHEFRAVGQFYDIFDQVSDQDAIRLLEESIIS
tara:strand:- start:459 stop:1085 length:627 start_codon:yes stop_codon:yes gene_type:complete